MLFLEKVNLFNHSARNRQTGYIYYGNTALCTIVHRAVKKAEPIEMPFGL